MDRTIYKYLDDIKHSIIEIESFISSYPRRFDVFCGTPILIRAIQMNIAIIGEAMNRLLKLQPDLAISHALKIVNTRNYVIHGYDSLRNEILWAIVINDLPILLQEVEQLLSQQNPKTKQ